MQEVREPEGFYELLPRLLSAAPAGDGETVVELYRRLYGAEQGAKVIYVGTEDDPALADFCPPEHLVSLLCRPDAQGQGRVYTRVAYGVHDLFEAARKALFRGEPLTDAVPPCAVRIPSAVYDKVFASCFPRLRNHFQFLLRRGVTGQAVHIVIENDRELLIVTIRVLSGAWRSG